MDDSERRESQRQALELLTVRVNQDGEAWQAAMTEVGEAGSYEAAFQLVMKRLLGMTEVAVRLLQEAARYGPSDLTRDPVDYLRVLALYLETEE